MQENISVITTKIRNLRLVQCSNHEPVKFILVSNTAPDRTDTQLIIFIQTKIIKEWQINKGPTIQCKVQKNTYDFNIQYYNFFHSFGIVFLISCFRQAVSFQQKQTRGGLV